MADEDEGLSLQTEALELRGEGTVREKAKIFPPRSREQL